ncbi:MAG: Ku protein [Simkaniaceae bacterium]
MRAIWTGFISFGLINIPVRLYSGSKEQPLKMHLLHEKDLAPIRYARICQEDGKEVPWEEIVKGYEYRKGDYVVLLDEDFEKANVKKTKSIEILDFTLEEEIDPIYFEKPYFLEPDKGAQKPYVLLREALKESKKVGVARFVLRNREHIGIIFPYKNIIILNQLRFASEIRSIKEITAPKSEKISDREIDVALQLIDQLTASFDPRNYKDTYAEELKKIIEKKAKGKPVKKKGKMPKKTKVHDLMGTLQKSLKEEQKKRKKNQKKKKPHKKAA